LRLCRRQGFQPSPSSTITPCVISRGVARRLHGLAIRPRAPARSDCPSTRVSRIARSSGWSTPARGRCPEAQRQDAVPLIGRGRRS
jgi:hypothetical protein